MEGTFLPRTYGGLTRKFAVLRRISCGMQWRTTRRRCTFVNVSYVGKLHSICCLPVLQPTNTLSFFTLPSAVLLCAQDYHQMDRVFKVPRCLHSPRKVTLRSTTPEDSRLDYNCCKSGEAQAGGAYSKGNVKSKEHSLVIHLICYSRHVFCSSIKDRWTTHRFQERTVISPKFPILPFSLRNVAKNSSPFPLGWKSVSEGSLPQLSSLLLSRSLSTSRKCLYLLNVDLFHLIHCQFLQRNWR